MAKTSSISSGHGDGGNTRLLSGEAVSKYSVHPRACGDVDELVSLLGVVRTHTPDSALEATVLYLQRSLFVVGSEMATTPRRRRRLALRVGPEMVAELEERRSFLESQLTLPEAFVLPGDSPVSAYLDLARAVARRCERSAVALDEAGELGNPHVLVWLNRLSDYLYLLARRTGNKPTLL